MSRVNDVANRMTVKLVQIKRKQAAIAAMQKEVEELKKEYSTLSVELWELQKGYTLKSPQDWNEADASNLLRQLSAI